MSRRILFVSFASYLDDASGASVASRAMMGALARRGFLAEVLCGPLLELGQERRHPHDDRHLDVHGVPITILAGSPRPRAPDEAECRSFLQLFERAWAGLRPDVVISYGGGPLTREVLRRAKARGATTVFPLHNLHKQLSTQESFATSLMYEPDIQGSVWIAISMIYWSWSETATNQGNGMVANWKGDNQPVTLTGPVTPYGAMMFPYGNGTNNQSWVNTSYNYILLFNNNWSGVKPS